MIPFITEEIWQKAKTLILPNDSADSIMIAPYPSVSGIDSAQADQDIEWIKGVIVSVRKYTRRNEYIPGKSHPIVFLIMATQRIRTNYSNTKNYLMGLAKLEGITWLNPGDDIPQSSTQLVGTMEVLVPMKGLIDVAEEVARLSKKNRKAEWRDKETLWQT